MPGSRNGARPATGFSASQRKPTGALRASVRVAARNTAGDRKRTVRNSEPPHPAQAPEITVRMLLGHRSGLPEWDTPSVDEQVARDPAKVWRTSSSTIAPSLSHSPRLVAAFSSSPSSPQPCSSSTGRYAGVEP